MPQDGRFEIAKNPRKDIQAAFEADKVRVASLRDVFEGECGPFAQGGRVLRQ
jgi:hypothetical protein